MWTGPVAYIGTTEIAMIIGAVVLLFGGAKIPQLFKGLGEGVREFKKSMDGSPEETPTVVSPPVVRADVDEANRPAANQS